MSDNESVGRGIEMRIIPTPEIKKKMDIVEKYKDGCSLRKDAAPDIIALNNEVDRFYNSHTHL